jgi:hypothetical protein
MRNKLVLFFFCLVWGSAFEVHAKPQRKQRRLTKLPASPRKIQQHLSLKSFTQDAQRALLRQAKGLREDILRLGLRAFSCAWRKGELRKPLLTLIDYSRPSRLPRLWVLDLLRLRVLYTELVAHGKNTGEDRALHFSNRPDSRQSSLGFFVTGEVYNGSNGFSLRLDGKEKGINHLARSRAIVMHGAWYVSNEFLKQHRRLGRSWGCPAVRKPITRPLLNLLKGKSALFIYAQQSRWLQRSPYLQCTKNPALPSL